MESIWSKELKQNAVYRIDENVRMVSIALAKIPDQEIWTKQNTSINTIGNLILHLCGNMTQYIVSGLQSKEDTRDRDLEFSTEEGFTGAELLQKLLLTSGEVSQVIKDATDEQLTAMYKVQGFEFSGIGLILHAVEHFSYHTGQIAFQVKLIKDEPLGFYAGMDLNELNDISEEILEDEKE